MVGDQNIKIPWRGLAGDVEERRWMKVDGLWLSANSSSVCQTVVVFGSEG